jgi:hypothetical protein
MYGLPKDFDGSRLIGRFLEQICYGLHQIQLRFDQRLTISVESAFLYCDPSMREPKRINIPGEPAMQSDLLHLLHHTIVKAWGEDEGTLALEFDNHHILRCLEKDGPYESYQISMGEQLIIV